MSLHTQIHNGNPIPTEVNGNDTSIHIVYLQVPTEALK